MSDTDPEMSDTPLLDGPERSGVRSLHGPFREISARLDALTGEEPASAEMSRASDSPRAPDLPQEQIDVIAAVLSRHIASCGDPRLVSFHDLVHALRLYAAVAAADDAVDRAGGLHVDIPVGAVKMPSTALRERRTSLVEIRELFHGLEQRDGARARLPLDLLFALMPVSHWPVIGRLILDGPGAANLRAHRAVMRKGRTRLPAGKNRAAGDPPARRTLETQYTHLRRLMHQLCELRAEGHPSPLLASWLSLPQARPISVGRVEVVRPAPTLRYCSCSP